MIKRKEINLTPRATEDLENLWFYSQEQFGLLKADEYIGRISGIFELIATHEVGIKRPELGDSLYSLPVEKHVVFFLVSELVIIVIRILNQSQDVPRHLLWH